jgi:uncharacterized protein (DUF2336 family)
LLAQPPQERRTAGFRGTARSLLPDDNSLFTIERDISIMVQPEPARASLLDDLERTLAVSVPNRRSEIAERITSLFLSGPEHTDEQADMFAQVLESLIDKIETRTLIALGERLTGSTRAPASVMRQLAAHDEILVAGPILSRHMPLRDDELVEISEAGSQAHLAAICERPVLREPVTDVLTRRGDQNVALKVTANPGARFSDRGFETLSERAASDSALAECLGLRMDVPRHIFCQILIRASEDVRRRMIAAARDEMHDEIRAVLDQIAGQLADELPAEHRYEQITQALLLRYPDGKISEQDVSGIALSKQLSELAAALSLVSGLPTLKVSRLLSETQAERIVILAKALGYSWPTTRAILQVSAGKRLAPDDLLAASEEFGRTSQHKAQQVLAFWRQH